MSPETHESITEPELPIPEQEPSDSLRATAMQSFDFRRRIMSCLAGPLAISSVLFGTSLEPAAMSLTDLGVRDAEIALNHGPQLDFQGVTATEAVDQTYRAFSLGNGFYIDNIGKVSSLATTWSQVQVMNMLDIANLLNPNQGYDQKLEQSMEAEDTYWDKFPAGTPAGYDASRNFGFTPPERYLDDNLWVGLRKLKEYQRTGDEADVNRVGQIMNLFIRQRDAENGGYYWKVQLSTETDHGQVMVSNATAIPILVNMYSSGHGDASYLTIAEQTFTWAQQLYDPVTGLYFDNISAYGQIEKKIFTYNQAEVLNAMVALNKVDSARYPLQEAIDFAKTTMDYFSSHEGYGISRFDVIYLMSLMHLASILNDNSFTETVQQAVNLAKDAINNSPESLADAAGSAAVLALSEMPFSKWASLG